jgi:two-component system, NarL family, nitrate/nitrite response regulator NarL
MDTLTGVEAKRIRIVIADEDKPFRESLRMTLEADGGIQIVGEAFDAQSTVELTCRLKPDILLLDFTLSQELEANVFQLRGEYLEDVRVLMMMAASEKAKIVAAFRLGVMGVVPKAAAPIVWFKSIRRIVTGQYVIGGEDVGVLVQALQEFLSQNSGVISRNYYGLTPRELEIVECIAHGRTNKEVGREFSIRERTVKHHLTNIFNKLGVSSRLELALFARDKHIVQGTSLQPDSTAQ